MGTDILIGAYLTPRLSYECLQILPMTDFISFQKSVDFTLEGLLFLAIKCAGPLLGKVHFRLPQLIFLEGKFLH